MKYIAVYYITYKHVMSFVLSSTGFL